jgi:hypothetical protein
VQALGIASALLLQQNQSPGARDEEGLTTSFEPGAAGVPDSNASSHVDFSLLRLKLEYRLKSEHLPSGNDLAHLPIHSEILFGPTEFTLPKVENALREVGFKTVRYGTNLMAMDSRYDRPLTVLFETMADSQTQITVQVPNKLR